jgi:hypothetical protein
MRWLTIVIFAAVAAVGPGISVGDARDSDVKGPLLVNGYLLVQGNGTPRLCTGLSAAEPPRCRRPFLVVHGLSAADRKQLASSVAGRTRWSSSSVQVLGRVRGNVLRVTANALA